MTLNHQCELISVDFAMSNNSQGLKSPTIYGGLLDRCTLNRHAEILFKYHVGNVVHGITYLKLISDLNDTSVISSTAVRLCFCSPFDSKPDCSYLPP